MHHSKNQEDFKWSQRKPSIDANIKMTEMLELSAKDVKAAIIKMLQ